MGLFDKINKNDVLSKAKDAANSAVAKAKDATEDVKKNIEQKKAEKEAREAEMRQRVEQKKEEIINTILSYNNEGSVFCGVDTDALLAFTKEYYDKLFMPAISTALTKISMYPYIDGKELEKIVKVIEDYDASETAIISIKVTKNQQILITDKSLYFVIPLDDSSKYIVKGRVSNDEIDTITFEFNEEKALVKCDGYVLAEFNTTKTIKEDFISLTNYFACIKNKDFEITDEEVDALIKEKIGAKIYNDLKKYMVYDDEQLVYFAWGLDSLAAKDYIVCTNKQIIILDREAFGATSNVKQFYYEDITSASTEQNSNSNDLTGYIIDTAITAATKTCDLYFSVAGARNKIKTLYKAEAERIVAVYHQFRKAAKEATAQPQVVVQQAAESPVDQLKKLNELKELGIISEEEFNEKKTELLKKL